MPIFIPPNMIYASGAEGVGAMVVEISETEGATAVTEVWKHNRMKNHFSSSILHDGHIYGFDNATLKCIDAKTGEQKWVRRGFGKGSLILADNKLYVLGDRGGLAMIEANPEAYTELGRNKVFEGKCWTAPTLSNGILYVRSLDEIAALEGLSTSIHPSCVGSSIGDGCVDTKRSWLSSHGSNRTPPGAVSAIDQKSHRRQVRKFTRGRSAESVPVTSRQICHDIEL